MRVLHLSHNRLPDSRIEKEAISLKKFGYSLIFVGDSCNGFSFNVNPFEKCIEVKFDKFTNVGTPFFWNKIKRRIKRILEEENIDAIHAHNIIAAKLAVELGYPFIYDDHEYWSVKVEYRGGGIGKRIKKVIWSRWEKEVLEKAEAVITVSSTIAKEHQKYAKEVITIPNYPQLDSVKNLVKKPISRKELYTVFMGRVTPPYVSYRDSSGFLELFVKYKIGNLVVIGDNKLKSQPPIYSLGRLKYLDMLREMTKYHIGVIPWKKHPYNKYSNPNKAYEYANTGLLVLVMSDLIPVIETLRGFVQTFDSYDDLVEKLMYYSNNVEECIEIGIKTMEFARKNLIWEKNENLLEKVYKKLAKSI
ncbi:MAG: glycosyltransferase [Candidatus Asgardarchaeia archaeon]